MFAVVVAITSGSHGRPAPGAATGGASSALPPRYAALARQGDHGTASDRLRLLIRDTVTGQTLGTVDPPRPDNSFCDLSGTPDGRTFVVESCTVTVTGPSDGQTVDTSPGRFYRLTVDDQGKVGRLSPLSVPVPGRYDLDGLAVSPDGSKLAVASADHSHDFGREPAIQLYSLDTGQLLRSWIWPGVASIFGRGAGGNPLSWTADGSAIAFPLSIGERMIAQVRVLDTAAPSGSLRSTRLVLDFGPTPSLQVAPSLDGPDSMITPDGSRIVASTAEVSHQPTRTHLTVSEYSAATSARAAVLAAVTLHGNSVLYRSVLWSSPDGSKLIVGALPDDSPSRGLPVGVLTRHGFTPLPGSQDGITQIAF
ncbi:MAG TPA: hypothetical protein VGQ05_17410 [Streptosporangiaceae bacterium]|nr:hypothetical protein [Streptosporangiaceae bacterium]